MKGLNTFHANPLSLRVSEKLEFGGYGQLLATTPQRDVNTLASLHFRNEFDERNIYSVSTEKPEESTARASVSHTHQGHFLGEDAFSFKKLSSLLSQGANIKATRLTVDYSLEAWREANQSDRSLLMAISPEGRLRILSPEHQTTIKEGWIIISIDSRQEKPPETSTDPKHAAV